MENKKIAIVYDWIDKWGGVERVLLHFHKLFPKADFFASYVDYQKAGWAKNLKIKTSFIQNLPNFIKKSRILSLPFYPYAFESFDFSSYDIVISISSSFAKSIITKPGTLHICYLLTPTRFLWVSEDIYLKKYNFMSFYIKRLKKWDFVAAQRPDEIISISKTVSERCFKNYKRKSEVIYPPFDRKYWGKIKCEIRNSKFGTNLKLQIPKKYYLIVSRLEPYKMVGLAIKTFNQLKEQLVIVGEGSCENNLKSIANNNIIFLKKLKDEELGWLYGNAKALVMPQEEDFGYTALEAQFFGCPVIAFKKGGATETVIEGKTGVFFDRQTEKWLLNRLASFNGKSYNFKEEIIDEFNEENFNKKIKDYLNKLLINKNR